MGEHVVNGQFQTDKYAAWCPPGFLPLKLTDRSAWPHLWAYAQVRRAVDPGFADDLETCLRAEGYVPPAGGPLTDEALRLTYDRALLERSKQGDPFISECGLAGPRAVAEAASDATASTFDGLVDKAEGERSAAVARADEAERRVDRLERARERRESNELALIRATAAEVVKSPACSPPASKTIGPLDESARLVVESEAAWKARAEAAERLCGEKNVKIASESLEASRYARVADDNLARAENAEAEAKSRAGWVAHWHERAELAEGELALPERPQRRKTHVAEVEASGNEEAAIHWRGLYEAARAALGGGQEAGPFADLAAEMARQAATWGEHERAPGFDWQGCMGRIMAKAAGGGRRELVKLAAFAMRRAGVAKDEACGNRFGSKSCAKAAGHVEAGDAWHESKSGSGWPEGCDKAPEREGGA